MKNLIILAALIAFAATTSAQEQKTKGLKVAEVTIGLQFVSAATATFPLQDKPFSGWSTLLPSLNMYTDKTHSHIFYDPNGNNAQMLNGYLLPKDCDVYALYSKNLNSKDMYLGVGFEKVVSLSKQVALIGFGELGTNFAGTPSVTFGLALHPQLTVWKRKG